ncbi:tetratricopeptide repeat-containing sensor histidine kinase [Flagellimonas onchidii]|uniref:tetratricopeptide repeat-containing sensor histidine kinase n=1 Tax=Flagellimonas onchidii TaxID=2562684 RepID=UPI0010A60D6C|nr:tetratricopeptide repeat protein [Allomuricauda onchidii]
MKFANLIPSTILIYLLCTAPCFAQNQKLDSLKNLLVTANDTTKVRLLILLCNSSVNQGKEMSLEYGFQALNEAKKIGFTNGEIDALYAIALTHGKTSSYAESLDFFKQSLSLARRENDFDAEINIYNSFGIIYKRIGDYKKSKDFYLKGLKLVDSLQHYEDNSVTSIYINLGILYDLLDQEQKAIDSYEKALETHYGPGYEFTENSVLVNIAEIDLKNQDYEAALEKFLRAAKFNEKHNRVALTMAYSNIGICYLNLKQWQRSEDYLLKSLQLAKNLSLKQEIAIAYGNLAKLMLRQGKMDEAVDYSNQNLNALQVMGEYEYKQKAHALASEIYEEIGSYSKAAYHLKQTMAYQDSLLNETKIREIQNLQIQHEVYLKDKEINENALQLALLDSKVTSGKRRTIYLSIISFLLLFSAALLYYRYLGKKKSNELFRVKNQLISEQNQVIEKMNMELEKRMLRAQMNPHFIFNSLNSIQHLINSNDKTNALKYLSKFSKLLRQVLESSINITLLLKEEIELLEIYLELESLRFDNAFSYKINVGKNLDVFAHEIPMLLVQPYVENAIIHGLMPKLGEKKLSISFNDKTEYMECVIEDNGVGINANTRQTKSKATSRGMSITAKRIDNLKRFADQKLLKVENLNSETRTGTKVTILIPKD